MLAYVLYLLVGAMAGIWGGLLGVGGGIINVPGLDFIFGRAGIEENLAFHLALGTSLAVIVFTSTGAFYTHYKMGKVDLPFAWRIAVSGIAGSIAGGYLASLLTARELKPAFGVLVVAAALKLLSENKVLGGRPRGANLSALPIGLAAGLVSGFLGVGGGIVAVPLLMWVTRMPPPRAVATSSAVVTVLSVVGATTYAITGRGTSAEIPWTIGYIHLVALLFVAPISILTARLGARLTHAINQLWLKRIFALMLLFVGGRFIWPLFREFLS